MSEVTIVIPNHNCYDRLKECIENIEKNTQDVDYQVFIMDSSDTDKERLKELYDKFGAKYTVYYLSKNLHFAQKCNLAVDSVKDKYICFLNNDTIPQPKWLSEMLKCEKRHEDAKIVGARMYFPGTTMIQHIGGILRLDYVPTHLFYRRDANEPGVKSSIETERSCITITAACMLVGTDFYKELGGFNEKFVNGTEDVDFCFRAKLKGAKSYYCPTAFLYHHEHGSGQIPQKIDEQNWKLYEEKWGKRIMQINVL